MAEKPSKRIKKAVKAWLSREGSKLESISNPRAEFLFKVKFRRFFFNVVRHSFSQGVTLGFVQPRPGQPGPKPPGPGLVVSERVYDDGFSEDRLWQAMIKVHSTVDMAIALLNEITGHGMKPPQESTDTGPAYYT